MSDLPVNDMRVKILIAEDDPIVALDLQGMIMRIGYDVVQIVENGQDAIAAAKRFQPELVLLEMNLPGTPDIIELAREIHSVLDIPVVFCLSSPDLAVLVRAKDLPYAAYLLKPVNPDSLSTTLDTVLYKFKMEKWVRAAEDKFRILAEKFDIIRFFFDEQAAFDWTCSPDGTIMLKDLSGEYLSVHSDITEQLKGLIQSSCCGQPGGDQTADKLSGLIHASLSGNRTVHIAVLGILNKGDGSLSGILIPLAGSGPV